MAIEIALMLVLSIGALGFGQDVPAAILTQTGVEKELFLREYRKFERGLLSSYTLEVSLEYPVLFDPSEKRIPSISLHNLKISEDPERTAIFSDCFFADAPIFQAPSSETSAVSYKGGAMVASRDQKNVTLITSDVHWLKRTRKVERVNSNSEVIESGDSVTYYFYPTGVDQDRTTYLRKHALRALGRGYADSLTKIYSLVHEPDGFVRVQARGRVNRHKDKIVEYKLLIDVPNGYLVRQAEARWVNSQEQLFTSSCEGGTRTKDGQIAVGVHGAVDYGGGQVYRAQSHSFAAEFSAALFDEVGSEFLAGNREQTRQEVDKRGDHTDTVTSTWVNGEFHSSGNVLTAPEKKRANEERAARIRERQGQ